MSTFLLQTTKEVNHFIRLFNNLVTYCSCLRLYPSWSKFNVKVFQTLSLMYQISLWLFSSTQFYLGYDPPSLPSLFLNPNHVGHQMRNWDSTLGYSSTLTLCCALNWLTLAQIWWARQGILLILWCLKD